jgi:tetratricopeptide (TPR) repeat protein
MADYIRVDRSFGGYRISPTTWERDLAEGVFDKGLVAAGSIIGNVVGASVAGLRNAARNAQDRRMQEAVEAMESALAQDDDVTLSRLAKEFTRRYPDNPHGHAFLASALGQRKFCDAAVAAADRAAALGLPEIEVRMLRASAFSNADKLGPAIQEFSYLIRVPETRDAALWNRARLLIELGDLELALADISQAISEFPDASNYATRAYIWRERQEYEKALDDYARAYKLNPSWTELREFRAELFDLLGKREEAARERQTARDAQTGAAWTPSDPDDSSETAATPDGWGPEDEARDLLARLFKRGIYLRLSADGRRVEASEPLDPEFGKALARLESLVLDLLRDSDSTD